jgi:hypothetical protein
LEEEESLTSHDVAAASAITAGLLVELDLQSSIPDTYRSPPTPLPYDIVFGCPQSTDSDSVKETISRSSFETSATCGDLELSDCKLKENSLPISPKKLEISKSNEAPVLAQEDEDVCPICLEGTQELVLFFIFPFSIILLELNMRNKEKVNFCIAIITAVHS